MARKAILEGGKRDEIIAAATQLFFQYGYEATSVRMILDQVHGEVGMFYHYFKSKDELFQCAVEHFYQSYSTQFNQIVSVCDTKEQLIEKLLVHYSNGLQSFHGAASNIHWTIQYAFTVKTIQGMQPAVASLIAKWGTKRTESVDLIAAQLLSAISATLHSSSFSLSSEEEKKKLLLTLINRIV